MKVGTLDRNISTLGKRVWIRAAESGSGSRPAQKLLVAILLCAAWFVAPFSLAESYSAEGTLLASQQESDFDKAFGNDFDRDFSGGDSDQEELIADPLISWNRGVFWVNDKLYFYLIKPVAKGYRLVMPKPVRSSVRNFFSNLTAPIRACNDLLQLRFYDFSTETFRFIVNSTLGIAGFFDPAEALTHLRKKETDFGLTMGHYGVGHGFYLVLPVVGPSSLRDGIGSVVDSFGDPLKLAKLDTGRYLGLQAFKTVNWLSLDPDTYERVIRDSIDPYLFIRAAYAQRRVVMAGKSNYTIEMLNIFDGTDFDFDIVNPLRWLGI